MQKTYKITLDDLKKAIEAGQEVSAIINGEYYDIKPPKAPETCKEIRAAQLDALKDGTGEAVYMLREAHHDGRTVRRIEYSSRKELEAAAQIERKRCEPYTHILLYAIFQI